MTLKLSILRCPRKLFIILLSLTIGMMYVVKKCLFPLNAYIYNLIKESWTNSNGATYYVLHQLSMSPKPISTTVTCLLTIFGLIYFVLVTQQKLLFRPDFIEQKKVQISIDMYRFLNLHGVFSLPNSFIIITQGLWIPICPFFRSGGLSTFSLTKSSAAQPHSPMFFHRHWCLVVLSRCHLVVLLSCRLRI